MRCNVEFMPKELRFNLQVIHPKTDDQRQRLQEACWDILLFKNLDPVSGWFHEHCVLLWLLSRHLWNDTKGKMAWGQQLFATAQYTVHNLERWLFSSSWNGPLAGFCTIVFNNGNSRILNDILRHRRKRCLRCWMLCLRSSALKGSTSSTKTMMETTFTLLKGDFSTPFPKIIDFYLWL